MDDPIDLILGKDPYNDPDLEQICLPYTHKFKIEFYKGVLIERCMRCNYKRIEGFEGSKI